MTIQEQIYNALRPKVASLGFNKKELMGIAEALSNNLNLDENAEDEAVATAINNVVDATIPVLKIGQSQGNRLLDAYKAEHNQNPEPKPEPNPEPKPKEDNPLIKQYEQMAELVKTMQSELNNLKTNNITSTRKSKLETLLKDKGVFGKQTLKAFERMSFENDEAFENYLDEVKADVEAYDKERSEAGLSTMKNHPNTQNNTGNDKVLTDKEIDEVANLFH